MKYLLASLLVSTGFASQSLAAPSVDEYAETHQTTSFGGNEVYPRFLMLTQEQKQRYSEKNAVNEDSEGMMLMDTYQDLFRSSAVVFRGRIRPEKKSNVAAIEVQRIYKGKAEQIPARLEIDDRDCLDHYFMGNNFVIFLGRNELSPTTPDFCELEIQEVYHPAMQYLDQWEKGVPYVHKPR